MGIGCLSTEQLVAVATGDAPCGAVDHVAVCRACQGRQADVEDDLITIVSALGSEPERPPVARGGVKRRRLWIGVAAAAVAFAMLTSVSVRARTAPPADLTPPPMADRAQPPSVR